MNQSTARAARADYIKRYMRDYRKRVPESDDVTCNLCGELFQTGAAYTRHFKERWFPGAVASAEANAERRFGPEQGHTCYTRDQMRDVAGLLPDWDTGSWAVRRQLSTALVMN